MDRSTGPATCPACAEPAPPGANWCEACGADLAAEPAVPCVACGESDISADGYCMSCGRKQPAARDRVEVSEGAVVAISDRGRRHHHNEDAVAIGDAGDRGVVLVVCDGVSSTPGSAEASLAAAEAARDLLVAGLGADEPATAEGGVERLLVAATEAAQAEATRIGSGAAASSAPSSTFVAAVAQPVDDGLDLSVAWVGDSRAYWVADRGATPLTRDHELDGSLTRWLGADAGGVSPDLARADVAGPGRLIVCSDGLWRYTDPPARLHELIMGLDEPQREPVALAPALVAHALDEGGHDNISVAVWAWAGPDEPVPKNQAKETR